MRAAGLKHFPQDFCLSISVNGRGVHKEHHINEILHACRPASAVLFCVRMHFLGEMLRNWNCSYGNRVDTDEIKQRWTRDLLRIAEPPIGKADVDFDLFEHSAILIEDVHGKAKCRDFLDRPA